MSEFVPGDVVQMKSGSPLMTVYSCEDPQKVFCAWFDAKQQGFRDEDFPSVTLEKWAGPCKISSSEPRLS